MHRWGVGGLALALAVVALFGGPLRTSDAACANPVVCENALSGNPPSEWDIQGSGDARIQGFATDISVNLGGTVHFEINTPATAYHLDVYRMGYYAGLGARRIATLQPSAALPQTQPGCLTVASTGLIDCGNWAESASWSVPTTSVSGIYFARLTRDDGTPGTSHIVFVVRDDASHSDVLVKTSDTTWQAYNSYGGNSLYTGAPGTNPGRAYKVSYNRPFSTRDLELQVGGSSWVFGAEYPLVRFLEANGYNTTYLSSIDADRYGNLLSNHRIVVSVGHDEYWSGHERASFEAARGAGTSLAFFSGNEAFWKTRWENSIDGSNTTFRTLVSYKETHANAVIDPADPPTWTGTWRDPRFSPPADGGRPENALLGTIFTVNGPESDSIVVSSAEGRLRFWRNTSLASLPQGGGYTTAAGFLGGEWDEDLDNGARPAGLIHLSTVTVSVPHYLQDYGSTYAPGTATHHLSLYRHASGARVFGAGTIRWVWGLDATHDVAGPAADLNIQQATVNLLADMGVQPATLQSGLVAATGSADTTAPSSSITSPSNGATVSPGVPITIGGTASDVGGVVGGVEVSTDGGSTWHPATGTSTWSYVWTPSGRGTRTLRSRATDDSGNIETPSAGLVVSVGSGGSSAWRLDAGASTSHVDSSGNAWSADQAYTRGGFGVTTPGYSYATTSAISGTSDPTLYQTNHHDTAFEYRFDVPNGTYQVRLRFAEIFPSSFAVGARVFNVAIEGATVLSNFDVYATAGADAALDETFAATVSDGQLNITFAGMVSHAAVNAIEVIPQ